MWRCVVTSICLSQIERIENFVEFSKFTSWKGQNVKDRIWDREKEREREREREREKERDGLAKAEFERERSN